MVQKSQLNISSTSVLETAEPPSHPISQVVLTSLPALLQQSLTHSTTPMVYIPVVEQSSVHEDSESTLKLILSDHQCYDDYAGMDLRRKIVSELDTLVKQWIRSEGLRQNLNWNQVEQVGGKVVSYGSYKLQVVEKESDLDLLCIIPKHVTREDFFKNLYELLAKKDEVTELRQLPWAFVPVIKMVYRGIEVDLTMARLMGSEKIPEDEKFLQNPMITKDLDIKCLRSLNGYRATCEILKLVPSVDKFRLTLRVVKLWARKNGIYGNIFGFLGGASWAISVAKVCQMAGDEGSRRSCANMIYWFFHTFVQWNWPEPVYIKKVGEQSYPAWNPAMNHYDREHAMPIITPSIPHMNSAVNVDKTNCRLITAKCEEALVICQAITEGSRPWSDLFQPVNFFEEYDNYILISGSCRGDRLLWFGSIESKLRTLNIRIGSCSRVSSVRVWPLPFARRDGTILRQMWFYGIRMMVGQSPESIQDPLHIFTDLCMTTVEELSSPYASTFSMEWQHVPRSQLSRFLTSDQLGLEKPEKLSYAAVTFGQGSTMTSPVVVTSMQSMSGYVNTVPILSPAPKGIIRQVPTHSQVYPTCIPGLGVPSLNNYIVYSLTAPQPAHLLPNHVLHGDHSTYPAQQQLRDIPKSSNQYLSNFQPPNWGHSSPQPGGYPPPQVRTQDHSTYPAQQ